MNGTSDSQKGWSGALNKSGLYFKHFTIIIWLYDKTTIVVNLTLDMIKNYDPRVVIYDHKVRYKLKRTVSS